MKDLDGDVAHDSGGLIATADALDVRTKLMQSEVPLSFTGTEIPQNMKISTSDLPVVRHDDVSPKKPIIVHRPYHANMDGESSGIDIGPAYAAAILSYPTSNLTPKKGAIAPTLSLYATVKISNIPWDASAEMITDFLGKNTRLASYTAQCCPVHFILDRTSGKTQSEAYLEMSSIGDAERFAQVRFEFIFGIY